MATPLSELDREIALLRERLDGAEDMRRALSPEALEGFPRTSANAHGPDGAPAAQWHAYVDRAPPATVTVAGSGRILHANQGFAILAGRSLRELYAAPMAELFAAPDRSRIIAFLGAGRPDATLEALLCRPAGELRSVRLTAIDVGHGSVSLLVVDVEEEARRAEAESAVAAIHKGEIDAVVVGGEQVVLLADANRSYRDLIERMNQGAVSLTRGGDVLYANEPFASMLGSRREAVLGRSFYDLVQEGAEALRGFLLEPGLERAIMELLLRRADGSTLPVAVAAEVEPGGGAATLVLTDLTERRRQMRMQEETRRKDEFLAVLAHELRNPLASIRSSVEILGRSGSLASPERQAVQIIGRQSHTLVRLVDDLLDIHRLNQGKIAVRREPTPIVEIVHDALDAASPYLVLRDQRVQLDVPGAAIHVACDKVRLAQVLLNLLSNAAKFSPRGGAVGLRVESTEVAGKPIARITVTDQGCGIEPGKLETIFEPYVQLGSPGASNAGGLGLGLSVARRLVELHSGTIRAESEGPGHGSRFVLELPTCAPPGERPRSGRAADEPSAAAGLRVLIVDDSRDAAESLAMLVRLSGHEAHTVHDGASALAAGEELRPDVVFLDIGMPVLDGYATARKLRQHGWGRAVRLYALTGYGQDQDRQRTREAGFDRHFVKPIDPEVIDDLLAGGRGSRGGISTRSRPS